METGLEASAGAGVVGVGGMAMKEGLAKGVLVKPKASARDGVDDLAELVLAVEWERWRLKLRPFRAEERRELLLRSTFGLGEFVMLELDVVGRGTGTAGRGFSQRESRFWPSVRPGIRPPLVCGKGLIKTGRGDMAAESLWVRRCGLWLRVSRSRNVPATYGVLV